MSARSGTAVLLVVALTLFASTRQGLAAARKGPPEPSDQAAVSKPKRDADGSKIPLEVAAIGESSNRLGDPLYVTFTIANRTTGDVTVKDLDIKPDDSARHIYRLESDCVKQKGEIGLPKDGVFQQACRFRVGERKDPRGVFDLVRYLFSRDVRFVVTAELETYGRQTYYPTINVRAPEASIFAGGVVGALMLAMFVWIQKLLQSSEAREQWGKQLGFTLLLGLRGGIMAVIALILGKTTQGSGSPVSLTVSDFTGGVLVGLFSYPLAAWISSTLKPEEAARRP